MTYVGNNRQTMLLGQEIMDIIAGIKGIEL